MAATVPRYERPAGTSFTVPPVRPGPLPEPRAASCGAPSCTTACGGRAGHSGAAAARQQARHKDDEAVVEQATTNESLGVAHRRLRHRRRTDRSGRGCLRGEVRHQVRRRLRRPRPRRVLPSLPGTRRHPPTPRNPAPVHRLWRHRTGPPATPPRRRTPCTADDPHLLGAGKAPGVCRPQALEVGAHAGFPGPLLHQVPLLLHHPRCAARRPPHVAHRTGRRPCRHTRVRPDDHPRHRPLELPRLGLQPRRRTPRRPRVAPQGTGTAVRGRGGC